MRKLRLPSPAMAVALTALFTGREFMVLFN